MGLKRIHLALQPFLEGESRHGAAEDAAALERVKERIATGEWVLSATMIGFPQEDYSTLETIKKTGGVVPDDVWESNKKIVRAGAKLSAELKSPVLALHAGFLDESDPVALKKYTERVKFIVDTCGEAGVPVALETGQESAEDLAHFLSSMPGVGVNFDPANMILYAKGDPVAAAKTLGPWIRQYPREGRDQDEDAGHLGHGSAVGRRRGEPGCFPRCSRAGRIQGRVRDRARGRRQPRRRHRARREAATEGLKSIGWEDRRQRTEDGTAVLCPSPLSSVFCPKSFVLRPLPFVLRRTK